MTTTRAALFMPRARSGLVLVVGLDLADLLVGSEIGVLGHVDAVAAGRRVPPETLGQGADVMGSRAAAHPEVADPEPVGLAAEIEDLRARGQERVESHGE